ncbi:MAG: cytochrome c [Deltaproteobacteria bacterium]|nr:cytochrome c [Deltaproteobacteria bacterium]
MIQEGTSNIQGKLAFEKKVSCFDCHKYKKLDKLVGGLTGPSLAGAGNRLKADWVYAYLKDPKLLIPVKRMPIYTDIINDGEIKGIAQYISTFK